MQSLHESVSPIQLESLLEVPLQVVSLEDLLREKCAPATPPSPTASLVERRRTTNRTPQDGSGDKKCTATEKSPRESEPDRGNCKCASCPCLFDCCTRNPKQLEIRKYFTTEDKFKTTSFALSNGKRATVPVMNVQAPKFTSEQHSRLPKIDEAEISKGADGTVKITRGSSYTMTRQESDNSKTREASVPHHPSHRGSSTITPSTGSVPTSPIVLGKVTEKPTRYEDFLLAQCYNAGKSKNSRNGESRLGDTTKDEKYIEKIEKVERNTLKLTFYNEGRKESVKEFQCEKNMRFFDNQLQMSRVPLDQQRQQLPPQPHPRQQIPATVRSTRTQEMADNTRNFFANYVTNHSGNNNATSAPAQLKQGGSISSNRSAANGSQYSNHSGGTWEQWDGLQISRCQKNNGHIPPDNLQKEAGKSERAHGEPHPVYENGGKGDSENSLDRHLQAYLTSLKYVKSCGGEGEDTDNSSNASVPGFPPEELRRKLAVPCVRTGTPHRACSPSSGGADISRVPNLQAGALHHQDAWPERTIARIPTRPYLRRNVPVQQPPCIQPSPPKRCRSTTLPSNPLLARQQEQQAFLSRYPVPGSLQTNIDHLRTQQQSQLSQRNLTYNNLHQQHHPTAVRPPYHSPTANIQVQTPHHSPLAHLKYQQQQHQVPPSQQNLQDSLMIAAAASSVGNSSELFGSSAYYERLRRYWEYYQTQEVDWSKLTSYYQKYRFYPWDILTVRDTVRDRESARHWRMQQQLQLDQQHRHHGIHPQSGHIHPSNDEHRLNGGHLHSADTKQAPAMNPSNYHPMNYSKLPYPVNSPRMPVRVGTLSPELCHASHPHPHNSQQELHLQHLQLQQKHMQLQEQAIRFHQEQQKAMRLQQHHQNHRNAPLGNTFGGGISERNFHASVQAPPVTATTPALITEDACQSTNFAEEASSYPVNIHKHALQLAMKHNLRADAPSNTNNGSGLTPSNNGVNRTTTISSPSPPSIYRQQKYGWPIQRRMNESTTKKESSSVTGPSSSPTASPQTSVIRKAQQQSSSSTLLTQRKDIGNETERTDSPDNIPTVVNDKASLESEDPPPLERDNLRNDSPQPIPLVMRNKNNRNEAQLNDRHYSTAHSNHSNVTNHGSDSEVEILTPKAGDNGQVDANEKSTLTTQLSPIPMAEDEEEVVTSVSPSAVINNAADDDDDDDNNDGGGDPEGRTDPSDQSARGWQYDHVVLLDKRIKTYMCKRCFETLKTEQQIRNHLFCKMLANHVQCHVCLQLITADAYPEHLQVHGMKTPPIDSEETCDSNGLQGEVKS